MTSSPLNYCLRCSFTGNEQEVLRLNAQFREKYRLFGISGKIGCGEVRLVRFGNVIFVLRLPPYQVYK